jgi:hypothetical protein
MTLKPLFFDLETIPNYELSDEWLKRRPKPDFESDVNVLTASDAELEEEAIVLAERRQKWTDAEMKSMALQPEACKLVGLNVILGDGEPRSGWVKEVNPKTGEPYEEPDLLALFWNFAAQSPRLIGFNCNRFDLHVIRVRSAILGVLPTIDLYDIKPWDSKITDLLERRFKGVPTAQYLSLKALRALLGFEVPEKYAEVLSNTGGEIESLYLQFLSGDAEALRVLKLYGELDVWTTRRLAQMFQGLYFQRFE